VHGLEQPGLRRAVDGSQRARRALEPGERPGGAGDAAPHEMAVAQAPGLADADVLGAEGAGGLVGVGRRHQGRDSATSGGERERAYPVLARAVAGVAAGVVVAGVVVAGVVAVAASGRLR
jgi:hypothetical protein